MTRSQQRPQARFLRENLDLLGFGTPRDALVQGTKELFENALDAVGSNANKTAANGGQCPPSLLRVRVLHNRETGLIDIICGDTGVGMWAHQIESLCCDAFATNKNDPGVAMTCGRYGIGLKGATCYSQLNTPNGCLRVVTTSKSSEIVYVELRIDLESERAAVVQSVAQFLIPEDHRCFSGTEMRLSVPTPGQPADLEDAADTLAVYFQSLRYVVPENVGFEFVLHINDVLIEVQCIAGMHAVDRFAEDFTACVDDITFVQEKEKECVVNGFGWVQSAEDLEAVTSIEISILRYANHVPLLNTADFYLCAITSAAMENQAWKTLGYQCRRGSGVLMQQVLAAPAPTRAASPPLSSSRQLILAIDVTGSPFVNDRSLEYGSMRKSTLSRRYFQTVQRCIGRLVTLLHNRGMLISPLRQRDLELVHDYAPLIAGAVASIAKSSLVFEDSDMASVLDAKLVIKHLQQALIGNSLSSLKYDN